MLVRDPANPLPSYADARREVAQRCNSAAQAALLGAVRAGQREVVEWLVVRDAAAGAGRKLPFSGKAVAPGLLPKEWEQTAVAVLLGAPVRGADAPTGSQGDFRMLDTIMSGWHGEAEPNHWGLDRLLRGVGALGQMAPARVGAQIDPLIAWLVEHTPRWAARLQPCTRDELLKSAAGGDAVRAVLLLFERAGPGDDDGGDVDVDVESDSSEDDDGPSEGEGDTSDEEDGFEGQPGFHNADLALWY